MRYTILFSIFLLLFIVGCKKSKFSTTPSLKFKSVNTTQLRSQAQTSYCVQKATGANRVNLEPCGSASLQQWEIRGNIGSLIIRQGNLCLARALGSTPNRVIMQGCSIQGSAWALTA